MNNPDTQPPAYNAQVLAEREKRRKRYRRQRFLREMKYGSAIAVVAAVIVVLFGFNLYWEFGGPGRNAAVSIAKQDAGLSRVTSTHYAFFSWCHSDLVGFHVTGYRNGRRVTVTSCVQPFGLFDYVRQPAL